MFVGGDWRRPPVPAQFALRVAVLSGFALVMFSIIFFRLWYLQVLSGDRYLREAQNNQVREITVQAPRGEVLDRQGEVLVANRTALALQIRPDELPRSREKRDEEFRRLGQVAGIDPARIREEIKRQTRELPANPVTLERDVPYDLVYYLRENQAEFPGVSVDRVYVRSYPGGTLAAHVLGYVGEVNEDQLKEPRYEGLVPGDEIGQAGVESTYDSALRGVNGETRVQVDATGQPTGGQLSVVEPRPGESLRLSIDADLQAAGESAVASFGLPGGFVAMDVDSGAILGLGSNPTYDPSIFAKPVIPPSTFEALSSNATDAPIFNRVTQGGYPTGSTFKPVTAVAALESGILGPTETIVDPGTFTIGELTLRNAGDASYGPIQLREALQVSSDVFFYNLGARAEEHGGQPIQDWARQLGIAEPTGIDVPGESSTFYLLPTPEWRNELYKEGLTDRPWSAGDNVNLAVGQGDLKTNPLQMAVAYAAIANGGEVVRPHVGLEVEDSSGRVLQEIQPGPQREVDLDPGYRQAILEGLHAAAQAPGGTSYAVFKDFAVPVAGKTGTAERPPQTDQSWYVVLAPYPDPQIVVAVTIERGGFGAEAAAPAAKQILEAYFGQRAEKGKPATEPDEAVPAPGTVYD